MTKLTRLRDVLKAKERYQKELNSYLSKINQKEQHSKLDAVKAMDTAIINLGDEDIYYSQWICLMPDQADNDDYIQFARSSKEYSDLKILFDAIIKEEIKSTEKSLKHIKKEFAVENTKRITRSTLQGDWINYHKQWYDQEYDTMEEFIEETLKQAQIAVTAGSKNITVRIRLNGCSCLKNELREVVLKTTYEDVECYKLDYKFSK